LARRLLAGRVQQMQLERLSVLQQRGQVAIVG
jgi:hypothetical protein